MQKGLFLPHKTLFPHFGKFEFFPVFFPERLLCLWAMKTTGRRRVTYVTTWGETIPGLTRDTDGRWRILGTKKRFSEDDERMAIARFRRMQDGKQAIEIQAAIEVTQDQINAADGNKTGAELDRLMRHEGTAEFFADQLHLGKDQLIAGQNVDPLILWGWLREKLLTDPKFIADRVGIPELSDLKNFNIPLAPVKLAAVLAAFKATKQFSQRADLGRHVKAWQYMLRTNGAVTINDLSTDALKLWRDDVRKHYRFKSQANLFGRVKAICSYVAKEEAMHVEPLKALLTRMEVLKPAGEAPQDEPHPIAPANFMRLVKQAEQENDLRMVAALWLSLNCCMYVQEVVNLLWSDIKADGVLLTHRRKTGKCIRAAVLWPETLAALEKLDRLGDGMPILMSRERAAVSAHQLRKQYRTLRTRAKVELNASTEWASMRDGAYSAACHDPKVEERFARVLAGHKAPGVQDKYVVRNPAIVAPACRAVRNAYLGTKKANAA
jgi:integrase